MTGLVTPPDQKQPLLTSWCPRHIPDPELLCSLGLVLLAPRDPSPGPQAQLCPLVLWPFLAPHTEWAS